MGKKKKQIKQTAAVAEYNKVATERNVRVTAGRQMAVSAVVAGPAGHRP